MSRGTREELLLRRERLRMRSGQLRQEWSLQVQVLRAPLGLADQARAAVQWLARNPEWPLGAVLLIVVLRPGRVLRWSGYAWQGFSLYRRVRRVLGTRPAI